MSTTRQTLVVFCALLAACSVRMSTGTVTPDPHTGIHYHRPWLCPSYNRDCDVIVRTNGTGAHKVKDQMRALLRQVRISRAQVLGILHLLFRYGFTNLQESTEYMMYEYVRMRKLQTFLDYAQRTYEGISSEIRHKLRALLFSRTQRQVVLEFQYNAGRASRKRYGMIVLTKSRDLQYFHCAYVLYKADFKLGHVRTRARIVLHEGKLALEVHRWLTEDDVTLDQVAIGRLKNFLRFKALVAFDRHGLL